MDPVLHAYKAQVYAVANMSRANRTAKFSRVLAAIDYAPQIAMLLAAAVLSIICILLYVIIITKWPHVFDFLTPYFMLVYESLWAHEGTRYLSFGLALTCLFTGILCAKTGGSWWLFYTCLFIQVAFAVGRILKFRSGYRYFPPDELEHVSIENRRTQRIQEDEPVDLHEAGPSRRTRSMSRRSTATSYIRRQN